MASLLVELQTEELPPKALKNLSEAFAQSLFGNLKKQGFVKEGAKVLPYGSPRRLAVHISDVMEKSPDVEFSQRLVPVKVGLDAEGKPTKALEKKMASLGINVPVCQLKRVNDGKQEQLFYDGVKPGYGIEKGLQIALEESIRTLPIPKLMSYQLGNGKTVYFVRPVKHLVALLDTKIIPVEVFGLKADRITMGHRFHTSRPIEINSADEYARQMCVTGKVIPSFNARMRTMVEQLEAKAKALGAEIIMPKDLVEEVAALTEFPVVYVSSFDKEFLDVPEECLILTMQQNQKYFALRDKAGKLMNQFLLVSQINAKDAGEAICSGNARVVRARLADAKFFYDQDRHETLESRIPGLAQVVYHNKLGNQFERSSRIQAMAGQIAEKIGADVALAERAAKLSKTDLRTLMVGEFPELQGIMGEYYALHDKEDPKVALAIREHYQPRFAGDALPSTPESLAVALADKMETLTGLFGIGQLPTGDKDPYALRRHALGVLRMLIEKQLPISLDDLIAIAVKEEMTVPGVSDASAALKSFFVDRLKVMFKDEGYSALEVEAVLSAMPKLLRDIPERLKAVRAFAQLPESASLAAANKRIENILKKADQTVTGEVDPSLFETEEEKALYVALLSVEPDVSEALKDGQYEKLLLALAPLKTPVDGFFDKVMVNADDPKLKANRLSLLKRLHDQMNQVAKLSCLAA